LNLEALYNVGATILAGVPRGAGIHMIFLTGLSYIIDVYLIHANSAIAGNTLVWWLVGGGFLLFATAMYHTLGVPWTTSLLGFSFLPCPVLFFLYGARIRKLSRYTPTA
jgi:DHA1 family multidrug resistance protein-like MFS transporter